MASFTSIGSGVNYSGIAIGNAPGGLFDIEFSPNPLIIAKDFDKLGVDIRSFKEPLKRSIQQVIEPSIGVNFDVGGRPAWDPLSSYTQARRRYEGYNEDKILVRSGKLSKVAQQFNIWKVDREKAYVDNLPQSVWYGALQQSGWGSGDAFGTGSVARPFMLIQEQDAKDIEEVFILWIEERMAAAGL